MSLDSDIRDLNRSVKTLVKAFEALNNTLVEIEKNRLKGQTQKSTGNAECLLKNCPPEDHSQTCSHYHD